MKVKAVSGVNVPFEYQPYQYITSDEAVEVENTLYYQRRLADGDLVLVTESQAVGSERKKAKVGEQNDAN